MITVLRGDRRGTDTDTQGEGHMQREAETGLMQRKPRATTGFWLHQPLREARRAPFSLRESGMI